MLECHYDEVEAGKTAPLDSPELEQVSFTGRTTPALLGMFRRCPIVDLEIGTTPYERGKRMPADRVTRVVERHRKTLKTLAIHDSVVSGGLNKAADVARSCARNRIKFNVRPAPALADKDKGKPTFT
ncbi:hypothetical protein JCM3774_005193 [Rhodotorula dairenensis]